MDTSVDVIRGLTVYETVPEGDERTVDVELCPGAHVYSLRLCATPINADVAEAWDPDVPLARLRLQDSEIAVYVGCCEFAADYPGVRWPAYAKLIVSGGVRAVLTLTYGHCA